MDLSQNCTSPARLLEKDSFYSSVSLLGSEKVIISIQYFYIFLQLMVDVCRIDMITSYRHKKPHNNRNL